MTAIPPEAAALFESFAAEHVKPSEADFETWIQGHPQHEAALRELWRMEGLFTKLVEDVLPAPVSIAGSIFELAQRGNHVLPPPETSHRRPGAQIGDFRLVRLLGAGGMGEVWEAEELSFDRRIALKLVREDRIDQRALEFFTREARAGGRLAHPGIVRVHSFGESDGTHWINLELVEGAYSLHDFISDTRSLDSLPSDYDSTVAHLVTELADALEAAHLAGVVHRDVKPQNVMLTKDHRPKVTDFGLARITNETALSITGEIRGTYLYMSPEQVRAQRDDIDGRSDIFSLGVLFYELMSLQRPFEGDTTHQIAQKILTWDPPSLSKLRSRLPHDLAVICAKALEKRPDDRYQSMAELAADLRSFLANEPIRAQPPGSLRRATKWTRRHPVVCAASSIVVAALVVISFLLLKVQSTNTNLQQANDNVSKQRDEIAQKSANLESALANLGTALTDVSEQKRIVTQHSEELARKNKELDAAKTEAETQRDQVAEERDRLEKVVTFQEGIFDNLDPEYLGARLRVGAQDQLVEVLKGRGQTDEEVQAELEAMQTAIAPLNFTSIGVNALETVLLTPAKEEIDEKLSEDPLTRARLEDAIADAFEQLGIYEPALELRKRSLATRREVLGSGDPRTLQSLSDMGLLLWYSGQYTEALDCLQDALQSETAILGEDDPDTLSTQNNLGILLSDMNRDKEALECLSSVLDGRRRTLGNLDRNTLASLANIGSTYGDMGRFEDALRCMNEALDGQIATLGEDDPETLTTLGNLAVIHSYMGNYSEALGMSRRAFQGKKKVLGEYHPDTLTSLGNLGLALCYTEDLDGALSCTKRAYEGKKRVLGDDHPGTLLSLSNLGLILIDMDRPDDALERLQQALENSRRVLGDDDEGTLTCLSNIGIFLYSIGRFDEALPYTQDALDGFSRTFDKGHPNVVASLGNLGLLLVSLGRIEDAIPLLKEELLGYVSMLGPSSEGALSCALTLGQLLIDQGRASEAIDVLEPAAKAAIETLPREDEYRIEVIAATLKCLDTLSAQDPTGGWVARSTALAEAAELAPALDSKSDE